MGRRLSDSQFDCLWALWLGSKGSGSNAQTLESLRRRGLAMVRRHQGGMLWEVTTEGNGVIDLDARADLSCTPDVSEPRPAPLTTNETREDT